MLGFTITSSPRLTNVFMPPRASIAAAVMPAASPPRATASGGRPCRLGGADDARRPLEGGGAAACEPQPAPARAAPAAATPAILRKSLRVHSRMSGPRVAASGGEDTPTCADEH